MQHWPGSIAALASFMYAMYTKGIGLAVMISHPAQTNLAPESNFSMKLEP